MRDGAFRWRLADRPVDGAWTSGAVAGSDAGCTVLFLGTARDHSRGRSVARLEYQAYPRMVGAELERIAGEVLAAHEVLRVAVEHATGVVLPGQGSVAVAVAAAHRQPAFDAAVAFMDALKARVPIWKREVYEDGSAWIGQGS